MDAALPILRDHQINLDRIEAGKPPANAIWLWGQGKAPKLPKLTERFGISGAMISALDLPRGLGAYCGLEVVKVQEATGYTDTNYSGKVEAALSELKTKDLAYIHVGAADEASHHGDVQGKVKAIECFDEHTLGPLLKELPKFGGFRILVACNHATPVALRQHTADAVPYVLFAGPEGKGKTGSERGFNEVDAKTARPQVEDATKLIGRLLSK
jgi:2,3-bisphosphoglycerate-independent phosphoglycerate mutase